MPQHGYEVGGVDGARENLGELLEVVALEEEMLILAEDGGALVVQFRVELPVGDFFRAFFLLHFPKNWHLYFKGLERYVKTSLKEMDNLSPMY